MNPTTTPGTVFSTPSDREVAWTRSFAAPRERVFWALTEPEHVQRWMLGPDGWTMPVCEMDLASAVSGATYGATATATSSPCRGRSGRSSDRLGSCTPRR